MGGWVDWQKSRMIINSIRQLDGKGVDDENSGKN
jgi:hypothetical protein